MVVPLPQFTEKINKKYVQTTLLVWYGLSIFMNYEYITKINCLYSGSFKVYKLK